MNSIQAKKMLIFCFLAAVSLFTVMPFYIMLVMGTLYSEDLFKRIALWPGNYFLQNLGTLLDSPYLLGYFNSVYVSVLATIIGVFSSAMAGYAFAKYRFRLSKLLFIVVLATMMIPPQLGLIAFLWEMKHLGWTDTHFPLIIPAITNSFGVFWLTQYIKDAVPNEVIESARIDGCGEFRTFMQIVLPFVVPAMTSIGLLLFIMNWNSYMVPLVIISKVELYTIPLVISSLRDMYRIDYGAQLLGLSLGITPLVILFIVFSKTLISGLSATAVKG